MRGGVLAADFGPGDRPDRRGRWQLTDLGHAALAFRPPRRDVPVLTPAALVAVAEENRAALAALTEQESA